MAIYSGFSQWKWWFSIVMLVSGNGIPCHFKRLHERIPFRLGVEWRHVQVISRNHDQLTNRRPTLTSTMFLESQGASGCRAKNWDNSPNPSPIIMSFQASASGLQIYPTYIVSWFMGEPTHRRPHDHQGHSYQSMIFSINQSSWLSNSIKHHYSSKILNKIISSP